MDLVGEVEALRQGQGVGVFDPVAVGPGYVGEDRQEVAFRKAVGLTSQVGGNQEAFEVVFPVTNPGFVKIIQAKQELTFRRGVKAVVVDVGVAGNDHLDAAVALFG